MRSGPVNPKWRPRADIYRRGQGWLIKLDLAGVAPNDVRVWLEDQHLHVSGVRRDRTAQADTIPYAMEIAYSRFERVFHLPERPEEVSIQVGEESGMLVILLEESDEH